MTKKLITGESWKEYLRARQAAELRKLRPQNAGGDSNPVRKLIGGFHKLDVPPAFSLRGNPNEIVPFLNRIELLGAQTNLQLNFDAVTQITPDAIAALIATISKATLARTVIRGNLPDCEQCKQILEESGFFDHVRYRRSLKAVSRGRIQRRQSKKVEPVIAMELIANGTSQAGKEHSEASYRILIEGMGNTLDHAKAPQPKSSVFGVGRRNAADLDNETWWAMAYVDNLRHRVCFVFLDTGVGIFKSVKIKSLRRLYRAVRLEPDTEVLRDLLLRRLGSRTGLAYRGKGLPAIRDLSERGEVHELTLITNRVIAEISSDSYELLSHPFHGTLLYWEI